MDARLRVMALVAAGIPLSLLMDLADPAGPDSAEILRREGVRTVVLPGAGRPAAVLAGGRGPAAG